MTRPSADGLATRLRNGDVAALAREAAAIVQRRLTSGRNAEIAALCDAVIAGECEAEDAIDQLLATL